MTAKRLAGIGVLVTRPEQQAGGLRDAIRAEGGEAVLLLVMVIRPRSDDAIRADVAQLGAPDITVFVSRNAVEHGIAWSGGALAAIGPTTADAIREAGGIVEITPDAGFDSEHLLAEPAFNNVSGKTIRIIRGGPGRELLAETLRARGARVEYLSAYERSLPAYTADDLLDLERRWQGGGISAVVVMSVRSLHNLERLLPAGCRELLRRTPLVTPAERVLKEAGNEHAERPAILAAGPQTNAMIDAIVAATAVPGKP